MNTKKWVKCVGYVVLVVALMWMPAAVQAAPVQGGEVAVQEDQAPVQGGDVESGAQWAPMDWLSGLSQLWDRVRTALGMQTEPEPPEPPLMSPSNPQSQESLTQESIRTSTEVRPAIDPNG